MVCLNFFIMIDLGIFVFEFYFFIYLKGRYIRQRVRKREGEPYTCGFILQMSTMAQAGSTPVAKNSTEL